MRNSHCRSLLGVFALLLALHSALTVPLSQIAGSTPSKPKQAGAPSQLVRGYLMDLYECWKSARSGGVLTALEKSTCLAATGDEKPSSQIAEAEAVSGIPSNNGEPATAIVTYIL